MQKSPLKKPVLRSLAAVAATVPLLFGAAACGGEDESTVESPASRASDDAVEEDTTVDDGATTTEAAGGDVDSAGAFVLDHIERFSEMSPEEFCSHYTPEASTELASGFAGADDCLTVAPDLQEFAIEFAVEPEGAEATVDGTTALVDVTYVGGFVETYSLVQDGDSWLISDIAE